MYGVSTTFVRSLGYYGSHSVTVPALTTNVTGYYVNLTPSSTTPLNRLLFNRLRQPCSLPTCCPISLAVSFSVAVHFS